MTDSAPSELTDPRFSKILAEVIEAEEAGRKVSLEEWIRRYPEFESQLRDFADSNRRLDQIAPRGSEAAFDNNANTILSGETSTAAATDIAERLAYLGDYELIEELARGGMGIVYRGRQISLNRPVAVKMILAGKLATSDDLARFRLEAEAAANLDHPGIVPIYEIGENQGHHYFSMKYISGESLAQRIERHVAASDTQKRHDEQIRESVQLVADVARAVHFAHQRGIIHRDLKPGNILIDAHGQPHVTDFGLAKRITDDSHLTHAGAIVGTPSYMAPEQARGQERYATTAIDIYGLGAILYAALAHRPPFQGTSALDTLLKVQNENPRPLTQICPDIDRALERVCQKCLAKDPESRYRSAGELSDDLERWLRGDPTSVSPPSLASMAWRWFATNFRTALSIVALGLLTGILIAELPRGTLVQNLSPFMGIYHGGFPGHPPPPMLEVLVRYPMGFHVVAIPLSLVLYLSMGWLADSLARPTSAAGAILVGLGVGTAGALAAFVSGIGWMMINQEAVWLAQPDLELLAGAIDHDSTFTNGRILAETYPQVSARQVLKKSLIDLQANIPIALTYGLLGSIGLMFLPATLQVWAAFLLRQRGDRGLKRYGELIELSLPFSLLLIGWGFLLYQKPLEALLLLIIPAFGAAAWLQGEHWTERPRRILQIGIVVTALVGLLASSRWLFSPSNADGFSLGLLMVGSSAAACAVFQRWPWWARLTVYATWFATFCYAGGIGRTLDPAENQLRMIVCLVGSVCVIALMIGAGVYCRMARDRKSHKNVDVL